MTDCRSDLKASAANAGTAHLRVNESWNSERHAFDLAMSPQPSGSAAESGSIDLGGSIDQENLRERLLSLILRVGAYLGPVIYLPSVFMPLRLGQYLLVAIDTATLILVLGLYRFDQIPFRWRASAICLITYAQAMGLLVTAGSMSQNYLFAFSVLMVLLFGLSAGVAASVFGALSLLVVGGAGYASPEFSIPGFKQGVAEWLVISINFSVVNTLLTLTVGAVLRAVNTALSAALTSSASLNRQRQLLRTLIDALPDVVFTKDIDGRFMNCNAATLSLVGADREEDVAGKTVFDLFPKNMAGAYHDDDMAVMAGTRVLNREEQSIGSDGAAIWYLTTKVPLHDSTGEVIGLVGISRDITGRKRLEGQLRQAQKMEGIGQLAGGVAHDFNNLLTVVLSYSDLILEDPELDANLRADIEEVRQAGLRASDLTRQLLLFSRQQVIQPTVFDLNELMSGMGKMLRRLLGEDIELTTIGAAPIGRVRADRGSIEQVLVNLVVNARDAMPVGGKLTIETADVELDSDFVSAHFGAKPGSYVRLSVTDSGIGMDKQTLARIFEPFFTTKERGKGTGLGLSTVFGIVEQSGGTIWVYSKPGMGTTFKVYLPRVDIETDGPSALLVQPTPDGSETILLVEDEDAVRDVACSILRRSGYVIFDARNAEEALSVAEQHDGIIHLLLTDIVMPGMSGPELAKRLAQLRPEMKVLCMSGYTDDAAVRHGFVDAGFSFLQKPLTVASLTGAVRQSLDAGVQ